MSTLSMFDDPDDIARAAADDTPRPMYDSQRAELRSLFAAINLVTAREQFDLVNELTGIRLASVSELTASTAQQLILRLRGRVATHGRASTGNSWDDRDEDTWIDRL